MQIYTAQRKSFQSRMSQDPASKSQANKLEHKNILRKQGQQMEIFDTFIILKLYVNTELHQLFLRTIS